MNNPLLEELHQRILSVLAALPSPLAARGSASDAEAPASAPTAREVVEHGVPTEKAIGLVYETAPQANQHTLVDQVGDPLLL
jgi:hypothetical protein